ncbi:helix-turn-helix domain-containing protein [Atopococcus tabaci]|uniref:helix-turn-helix domain-containing protein n=1 Tax=Atopococcus tabaci TaxID=269774 RepID=UPI00240A8979|nr:helix-turn-helix domain-containing protein [Atopococcus tabaci]
MSEPKKSYYAIIPASVRYDENLTPNAKLLYGEITALCNEKGYCWAGDKYFCELYSVSRGTIQRWMKQLEDNNYIQRTVSYREGTLEIEHRYIHLCDKGMLKNETTPTPKNETDNNTSFNTTTNNTFNKNTSRNSGKPKYDDDSPYMELAKGLFAYIRKNNPEAKEPNLQIWADDMRKIVELDKRSVDSVKEVIRWCQTDNFWKGNILSARKLREKFDQLKVKSTTRVEQPVLMGQTKKEGKSYAGIKY